MVVHSEIVDAGIDDEAIEVWQPHVVAVGRWTDQAVGHGPTKLEIEHHVEIGVCLHESTWNRWKT